MRAFVLTGGASLGSVQVGMLRALVERGIRPDLLIGASAGAINAAWLAADRFGDLNGLADTWRRTKRTDVFPARPLLGLAGFMGRRSHLVPASGLRAIVTRELPYERIEDAAIPLHIMATDLLAGREVLLSRGDVVESVVASASIPAVFPPVELDGRLLVDGGVGNNAPISHAVALGADEVWVLPAGFPCALRERPRSALAVALQALTLLVQQRLVVDAVRYQSLCQLRVIPPICPLGVNPADFSKANQLMDTAYQLTRSWLASGAPAGVPDALAPHHHHP